MELNAEKTERLSLHSDRQIAFNVEYCGMNIQLKTLMEIKICGIWYCNYFEKR